MSLRSIVRKATKSSLPGMRALALYHRARASVLSSMSDERFAQQMYRRSQGRSLDFVNPKTFDERQWWLKLHYRDPLMVQCTDKIAVRQYVEEKGLSHLLLPLLGEYATPEEIEWGKLPPKFYLETNNSSATNIRCDDLASFDTRRAVRLAKIHLRRNHNALSREWNYRDIEPRLLIEPVIEAEEDGLADYRFLCSYGACKGIFVDVDTADERGHHRADARRNVYDRDWNLLDVEVSRPRIEDWKIERPARLEDMIRYAEALSEPFPFCRVDFHNPTSALVVFGEMTFFHAGGNNLVTPREFELILGDWIDISRACGAVKPAS